MYSAWGFKTLNILNMHLCNHVVILDILVLKFVPTIPLCIYREIMYNDIRLFLYLSCRIRQKIYKCIYVLKRIELYLMSRLIKETDTQFDIVIDILSSFCPFTYIRFIHTLHVVIM